MAGDLANNGALIIDATSATTLANGSLTIGSTGSLKSQGTGTGTRYFRGDIINDGAIQIDAATTFDKTGSKITNNGQFTISKVKNLTIPANAMFEQSGGSLSVLGGLTISGGLFRMAGGTLDATGAVSFTGSFDYTGGTILGKPKVYGDLSLAAGITEPFAIQAAGGTWTLADNALRAGQVVEVGSGTLTVANGFINNGTLTIPNSPSPSTFVLTDGVLINEANGLIDCWGTLQGNVINNGTTTFHGGNLNKPGTTFTNNNLVSAGTPALTGEVAFHQAAGILDASLIVQNGATFRYTGGEVRKIVSLTNATLELDSQGTSAASFEFDGINTLSLPSNAIGVRQTLTMLSTASSSPVKLTSANGFSNAGSIILSGTSSKGAAELYLTSGALVNATGGLIQFTGTALSGYKIQGDLTNAGGTVLVDHNATFGKSAGVFEQTAGVTTINANKALTFSNGSQLKIAGGSLELKGTILNNATTMNGGTINYTAGGSISGGSFTFNGGTTNGAPRLNNVKLTIGPNVMSPFTFEFGRSDNFGPNTLVLTDNVLRANQSLTIRSDTVQSAGLVSATGFTNEGMITLQTASFGGTDPVMVVTSGTLAIAEGGTIAFKGQSYGFNGGRLSADIENHGTFSVEGGASLSKSNGAFTNSGLVSITVGASLGAHFLIPLPLYEQTAGTTLVDGWFSAFATSRFDGGRLQGNGSIVSSVVNTGASVEPGHGVGTLSIQASYEQQAGGSLAVQLGGSQAGQFDKLAITGTASLAGTLDVQLVGAGDNVFSPQLGKSFLILSAAGGISGEFTMLNLPALDEGLAWKLLNDSHNLSLVVTLPCDFNGDGDVSAADFVVWRHTLGNSVARGTGADADFDGLVTRADLELWRANFGQAAGSGQSIQGDLAVPEPGPAVLVAVLAVIAVVGRVRLATAFQ